MPHWKRSLCRYHLAIAYRGAPLFPTVWRLVQRASYHDYAAKQAPGLRHSGVTEVATMPHPAYGCPARNEVCYCCGNQSIVSQSLPEPAASGKGIQGCRTRISRSTRAFQRFLKGINTKISLQGMKQTPGQKEARCIGMELISAVHPDPAD